MTETKRNIPRISIAIAIVVLVVLAGVLGFLFLGSKSTGSSRMQVVASFYPLHFFSSQIGGDRADVHQLIPDNAEPHSWEPSPADMVKVANAKVLVYNGAGFEPWITNFIAAANDPDLIVVDTSKNIPPLPSDTIKEPYERGSSLLQHGPNLTVVASATQAATQKLPFAQEVLNVTFSNITGGKGGAIILNVTDAGDYRFFVTENVTFSLKYANGTMVDIELQAGFLTWYPEFASSQFLELAASTEYVVSFGPSQTGGTRFVMVKMELSGGGSEDHHHGLVDPHFWIDPLSAKIQVDNILAGFVSADPGNATYYQANVADLKSRLDQLNEEFMTGLANRTKNAIITTHEGFNYLAFRYHFDAYGAVGISADQQPSPQDLARLTVLIRELGLHYVYSEPIYSDAVIETIARETGARVLVLDGIHGRTGVHANLDYFGIMGANLESLRKGLEVTQ